MPKSPEKAILAALEAAAKALRAGTISDASCQDRLKRTLGKAVATALAHVGATPPRSAPSVAARLAAAHLEVLQQLEQQLHAADMAAWLEAVAAVLVCAECCRERGMAWAQLANAGAPDYACLLVHVDNAVRMRCMLPPAFGTLACCACVLCT